MKKYLSYLIVFLFGFTAGEYIADLNWFAHKQKKQTNSSNQKKKKTKCNPFMLGFTCIDSETKPTQLSIEGIIPQWLDGKLIQVGPGQFKLNGTCTSNCCGGLSLVHSFSFDKGTVTYCNKFLETNHRKKVLEAQTMHPEPKKSVFSKVASAVFSSSSEPLYDNANINICQNGNVLLAMTESSAHISFDKKTLRTNGPFNYNDTVDCQFCTAHPLYDPETNEWFNCGISFGRKSFYTIYKIRNGSSKRELVTSIPVEYPSYMHSFAMTRNYIILTEIPFTINSYDLLLKNKTFIEHFKWEPKHGTLLTVIDKQTGSIVANCTTEPFFTFHHVNAFEQNNNIYCDIITFKDASIIKAYYLEKLQQTDYQMPPGILKRFEINLENYKVQSKILSKHPIAIARINEQYLFKPHQFVYGVSNTTIKDFTNQLVKLNLQNQETLIWHENNCYTREAVFVPKLKSKGEDDGILLTVVLDANKEQSFLLILDAKSLKEIGRAWLPDCAPFIIHGSFINS